MKRYTNGVTIPCELIARDRILRESGPTLLEEILSSKSPTVVRARITSHDDPYMRTRIVALDLELESVRTMDVTMPQIREVPSIELAEHEAAMQRAEAEKEEMVCAYLTLATKNLNTISEHRFERRRADIAEGHLARERTPFYQPLVDWWHATLAECRTKTCIIQPSKTSPRKSSRCACGECQQERA